MLFVLITNSSLFTLLTGYLIRSVRNFLHIELEAITIIGGIIGIKPTIFIIIGSDIIQINNLRTPLNIIINIVSPLCLPEPTTLLLLLLIQHLLRNRLNTAALMVLSVTVGVLVTGGAVEFVVAAVEEGASRAGVS